jgi:branched-chain amino acid transport system permease protein
MEAASLPEPAGVHPRRSATQVLQANLLPLLLVAALVAQLVYDVAKNGDAVQTVDDIKTGLSNGTIWALIALGYTLVYGIVELINFAHGEVFMIGSFVAVSLWQTTGVTAETAMPLIVLSIVAFLMLSMLASGVLNVMIERVAYRPLRNAPKLAPLITAIAMSFILQNVGLLWRPQPDSAPDLIGSQVSYGNLFGIEILHSEVFAIAVTVPLLMGLLWFVGATRYGKAMRATAQDPDAARLMGIDVDRTIGLTFLLGGLMAGAAGLIYALYNGTIKFNQGFTAGLIAFTAAVMGGIGNLKGAVAGGLIIGIVQAISDSGNYLGLQLGPQWTPAVVFSILILIMVFRPGGLFGEETREG